MNSADFHRLCLDSDTTAEALASGLQDLLEQRTREDHRLDYKDGRYLEESTFDAAELRRDVAAFANSEGGVIVVGVAEAPDAFKVLRPVHPAAGCNIAFESVQQRVEHSLRSLSPALHPLPSPLRIELAAGCVCIVVPVRRSGALVPVSEKNHLVYYLRTGEGRHRMPEYLHADLVLGRRQRAVLDVEIAVQGGMPAAHHCTFNPSVRITNIGLTWLPDAQVGCIGFGAQSPGTDSGPVLSPSLRSSLVLPPPDPRATIEKVRLLQRRAAVAALAPFDSRTGPNQLTVLLPVADGVARRVVHWFGFVYIAPRGEPPLRYQLGFTYDEQERRLVGRAEHREIAEGETPVCWWGGHDTWTSMSAGRPELEHLYVPAKGRI